MTEKGPQGDSSMTRHSRYQDRNRSRHRRRDQTDLTEAQVHYVERHCNEFIIAADALFQQRLRDAFASGAEREASARAAVALKPSPGGARQIQAVAPRSYCGSSAAWAALAGE